MTYTQSGFYFAALSVNAIQMTQQLIIFDCDGVLIDSEILAAKNLSQTLSRIGYPIGVEDIIRRFTGMTGPEISLIIEKDLGRSLPEGYDQHARDALTRSYVSELKPIRYIHEVLDQINARMCVASNSMPEKLNFCLEITGLYRKFFPYIFSAAHVRRGKPAPDLFLLACQQMHSSPENCIVIEDSVAGIKAAVAAGMRVLGFVGGSHCAPGHAELLEAQGAELTFGDMRDLRNIICSD
jgi:HAD superfamily hydrolase (TIGR01509 family)